MQKFRTIYLLLTSFLFLNGCVSIKDFEKDNSQSENLSAVLDAGYHTALYKATIDIGSKHFSGLFLFKNFADTSHRIIFMSELGLNLLDLEYKNKSFKTISCIEVINKKTILNTLQNDLQLLIDLPDNVCKKHNYINTSNQSRLTKVKDICKGHYYYLNKENEVSKIILTKGFKHVEVSMPEYENKIPSKIEVFHKRIQLSIKLNLLKVK